jgi:hypothetical protein
MATARDGVRNEWRTTTRRRGRFDPYVDALDERAAGFYSAHGFISAT